MPINAVKYICKKQLESLSNITQIYCRITNLNGSLESGLEILEDLVSNLQNSTKIKDASFSIHMVAMNWKLPFMTGDTPK